MKRISVFDAGKGIAVLGMIFAHTLEGGVCLWDFEIEMNLLKKVSLPVLIVLSPFALVLLMGLFFTFITSVTCSLSVMEKRKYGAGAIMLYLFYRIVFCIVLTLVNIVCNTWWKDYDIIDNMTIQVPTVSVPRYSHTLDAIGACGFLVPLAVYLVGGIKSYKIQASILSVVSLVLLSCYQPIGHLAMTIATYFEKNDINSISLIFSKIGSGPFMLAQAVPVGLIGGVVAIILRNTTTTRELWIYDAIFSTCTFIIALLLFLFMGDFWSSVSTEYKHPTVRLLELIVELNVSILCIYLYEDPRRNQEKQKQLIKKSTFLRRISIVSLTAFIFEQYVCQCTLKVFKLFFGAAVDSDTKVVLWSIPVCVIYAVITTAVQLGIIRVWEFADYRFSCEHIMGVIMCIIFNQKDYNRSNYKKIIYGPNEPDYVELKKVETVQSRTETV